MNKNLEYKIGTPECTMRSREVKSREKTTKIYECRDGRKDYDCPKRKDNGGMYFCVHKEDKLKKEDD